MIGVDAHRIRGTGIMDVAGMLAALIDAGFGDAAVGIISAFNWKMFILNFYNKYIYKLVKDLVLEEPMH